MSSTATRPVADLRTTLRVCALLVTAVATGCSTAAPTPSPTPELDPWKVTPSQYRGQDGQRFTFECPPGGELYVIWGTDLYTDDSSACTAGVHAGAITAQAGGQVTVEIRPGEDSYEGSERNGITSEPYGQWGGSFVVVTD